MNKIIRRFTRFIFISFAGAAILFGAFYFLWLSPRYTVPILMYHHFGYEENTLFVTPENLEKQMEYLRDKGYNVITLDELAGGIKNKKRFTRDSVVVTIDDGYRDNFSYGWPVFKKYAIPATIFLLAGHIGKDDEFMGWDEVKAMQAGGITFGAHTINHVCLDSKVKEDVLLEEIKGSKEIIENNIGEPVKHFCYPTGVFSEAAKRAVADAGYESACTTNRGDSRLNEDIYALKRIKVTNSDTNKPFSFAAKLSGYYNLFRSAKKND